MEGGLARARAGVENFGAIQAEPGRFSPEIEGDFWGDRFEGVVGRGLPNGPYRSRAEDEPRGTTQHTSYTKGGQGEAMGFWGWWVIKKRLNFFSRFWAAEGDLSRK